MLPGLKANSTRNSLKITISRITISIRRILSRRSRECPTRRLYPRIEYNHLYSCGASCENLYSVCVCVCMCVCVDVCKIALVANIIICVAPIVYDYDYVECAACDRCI